MRFYAKSSVSLVGKYIVEDSEYFLHIPLAVLELLLFGPGLAQLLCHLVALVGLHLRLSSHLLEVSADDPGADLQFILPVLLRQELIVVPLGRQLLIGSLFITHGLVHLFDAPGP